jgi:hypothetical protein
MSTKNVIVDYHAGKCGIGKTNEIITEARRLHTDGTMVCIAARSIPLCDDIEKRIHQHNPHISVHVIHTGTITDVKQTVAAAIIQYLQNRSDTAILIITHEALSRVPWEAVHSFRKNGHLLIDENIAVDQFWTVSLKRHREIIDLLEVVRDNAFIPEGYRLLKLKVHDNPPAHLYSKTDLHEALRSRNWMVLVENDHFQSVQNKTSDHLRVHALRLPFDLLRWRSITFYSAYFHESLSFKWFSRFIKLQRIDKDDGIHRNGRVTIHYAIPGRNSRARLRTTRELVPEFVKHVPADALIVCNKEDQPKISKDRTILPYAELHGMNIHRDVTKIAVLGAYRQQPAHSRLLQSLGLDTFQATHVETTYQALMRTAFRDGRDVEAWCLDEETALALAKRIAKVDIACIEGFKVKENYDYNAIQRRQRYCRKKYADDLRKLDELKDDDTNIQLFPTIYSIPDPELRIPQHAFIEYLQTFAVDKVTRKKENKLFGMYKYKEGATNGDKESIDHALFGLPYDIDHGHVNAWINRVQELGLNATIYNSFNSTIKHPRFKVIIQTNTAMPPNVYVRVSKQLAMWIGLPVDKSSHYKGQRFFLPCQAKAGKDASFFHVIEGNKLDVRKCLEDSLNSDRKYDETTEIPNVIYPSRSIDDEQIILNRESMGLDLSDHHDRATFIKRTVYCGINPERARRQLRWKHSTTARQAADFASYVAFARRNTRRPRLR